MAGRPDEYFFEDNMPCRAKPWGMASRWGLTDFDAYVARAFEEGTTPNGWFGVKMAPGLYLDRFVGEVRKLPEYADPELSQQDLVHQFFPDLRFVYLTRRDKLRQAISWLKATEHNLWTSEQEPEPQGTPRYDFAKIDAQITLFGLIETLWQQLFSEWGVRPLTLVYEDFEHDHEATAATVLDHLGIDDPYEYDPGAVSLERLADDLTEEWAARYLREKQWAP